MGRSRGKKRRKKRSRRKRSRRKFRAAAAGGLPPDRPRVVLRRSRKMRPKGNAQLLILIRTWLVGHGVCSAEQVRRWSDERLLKYARDNNLTLRRLNEFFPIGGILSNRPKGDNIMKLVLDAQRYGRPIRHLPRPRPSRKRKRSNSKDKGGKKKRSKFRIHGEDPPSGGGEDALKRFSQLLLSAQSQDQIEKELERRYYLIKVLNDLHRSRKHAKRETMLAEHRFSPAAARWVMRRGGRAPPAHTFDKPAAPKPGHTRTGTAAHSF